MAPPQLSSNTAPILAQVGAEIFSLMAFVGVCEARATDIALCEIRWSLALPAIALAGQSAATYFMDSNRAGARGPMQPGPALVVAALMAACRRLWCGTSHRATGSVSSARTATRTGTMRWLLDLAVAFLALGVIETLVKPLARRFVQCRILAAAPLLFRQLDPLLPALLQRCSGAELEQVVRRKLEALTGESWAKDDLGPLFALFDPRAAADHALGQMSDDAFSRWLEGATPEELERWQP